LQRQRQPEEGVTYAAKIDKAEARLDWNQSAEDLARKIRAFNPFPGAVLTLGGEPVKIWRAEVETTTQSAPPGQILATSPAGILVVCGNGALRLLELQKPGGKRLAAAEFVAGLRF
jgi:methionyl-tRNA formyltransferase